MKTKRALLTTVLLFAGSLFAGAKPPAATGGTKPYPLKTCIVSDNKLGSMGDEQRLVHNGQEVKFCCKPCIAKFKKNPEKYLPKLR